MTFVLGIDPGYTRENPTGLALIQSEPVALLGVALIKPLRAGIMWNEQLRHIARQIRSLVAEAHPEALAYELLHVQENVQTCIKLAHICGAVATIAMLADIPCVGVQPSQAKVALAKRGTATKADMIAAARQIFGANLLKDAADAVGVALAGAGLLERAAIVRKNGGC